jgi:site-specific DNA-methyltransferase (adenine-specific)
MALHPTDNSIEVRNGDLTKILPVLEPGTYDLIVADPPYGLGADQAGFRARTAVHHNYVDTPEVARILALAILTEGFRICKPRANIFLFCDIDLFDWLKRTAGAMGWVPFRRPLIWIKSESEGMAPWGGSGPRVTTEFIFYATKGQRGLISAPTDVFTVRRVSRTERVHAAEKPVELIKELVKYSTLPGDAVLDPCCGSGSTLLACKELKRRALGIEKDEDYYNVALANLHET